MTVDRIADLHTEIAATKRIYFYEVAIDELDCGSLTTGCQRTATIRIEWACGIFSVACDEHAAVARRDWPKLIRGLTDWPLRAPHDR